MTDDDALILLLNLVSTPSLMSLQVLDMVPRCSLKSFVEEKTGLDATSKERWGHGQVQDSVMFREEKRDKDTLQTKLSSQFSSLVFS